MDNLLNYIKKITLFFAIVGFNFSCSKDIVQTTGSINTNGEITINAIGIENQQEAIFKSSSSDHSNSPIYTIDKYEDIDLVITIIDNSIQSDEALKMKSSVNLNVDTLGSKIKFVLYIYDGDTFVTSKTMTAGISSSISGLDPTKKYKWSAVSYNDTAYAPDASTDTELTIPKNTELLFANGEIDLKVTQNISVLFKRALARIIIELNTIGVSGNIICPADGKCLNISPSEPINLFTGTIDVRTGTVEASKESYHAEFNFKNVNSTYHDRMQTVLYTTVGEPSTPIKLVFANIKVRDYDGYQDRIFFTQSNAALRTRSYSVNNDYGKSKRLVINLVHASLVSQTETTTITKDKDGKDVTTKSYSNIVRWARSNLYYRAKEKDSNRRYALLFNNESSDNINSFFAYNTKIPNRMLVDSIKGDPCLELHPKKLWRLPTQEELKLFTMNNTNAIDFATLKLESSANELNIDESHTHTPVYTPNKNTNSTRYIPQSGKQYAYWVEKNEIKEEDKIKESNNSPNNNIDFYYNGIKELEKQGTIPDNLITNSHKQNQINAFWTSDLQGGYISFLHKEKLVALRTTNTPTNILKNIRCVRSNHNIVQDDKNNVGSAP